MIYETSIFHQSLSAITALGVEHVLLFYHYLNTADLDGLGSLLDDHVQLRQQGKPAVHGRENVLKSGFVASFAQHHIHTSIARDSQVFTAGRLLPTGDSSGSREFNDAFVITKNIMIRGVRRDYL